MVTPGTQRRTAMGMSYNKLWKLLIDKNNEEIRSPKESRNQFIVACEAYQGRKRDD